MKDRQGKGRPLSDPLRGKKQKKALWLHRDAWEYLARIDVNRSAAIDKLIRERGNKVV